jgi:hypothetical protein
MLRSVPLESAAAKQSMLGCTCMALGVLVLCLPLS